MKNYDTPGRGLFAGTSSQLPLGWRLLAYHIRAFKEVYSLVLTPEHLLSETGYQIWDLDRVQYHGEDIIYQSGSLQTINQLGK